MSLQQRKNMIKIYLCIVIIITSIPLFASNVGRRVNKIPTFKSSICLNRGSTSAIFSKLRCDVLKKATKHCSKRKVIIYKGKKGVDVKSKQVCFTGIYSCITTDKYNNLSKKRKKSHVKLKNSLKCK